jgi:hypothetical protein
MACSDVYQRRDVYGRRAEQTQAPAEDTGPSTGFDPAEFMGDLPGQPLPETAPSAPESSPAIPPPVPTETHPSGTGPQGDTQVPDPTVSTQALQKPKAAVRTAPAGSAQKTTARALKTMKGAVALKPSFRVMDCQLIINREGQGIGRFQAQITFNADVDPASIAFGTNFRILVRNMDGFWLDAYPQGGDLQVNGRQLIWTSQGHVIEGTQKLHLRGTIQNLGGDYLDCDGDGQPEGGSLPPYESETINIAI